MNQSEYRRYRSPARIGAALLMAGLSAALLAAACRWYPVARQAYFTEQLVAVDAAGARELAISAEDAERFHLLSAAQTLDRDGRPTGYVTVTERQGYKSAIRVQATFSRDGSYVAGIRVLAQDETEYLGVRVAGEGFLSRFAGRKMPVRLWQTPTLGSPIDGLSGSTVSSQAVVDAVNDGWAYVRQLPSL